MDFEKLLIETCQKHLKDDIDTHTYAMTVLNMKFDGHGYGDCHHEIRGYHTKSGNPVVVSC